MKAHPSHNCQDSRSALAVNMLWLIRLCLIAAALGAGPRQSDAALDSIKVGTSPPWKVAVSGDRQHVAVLDRAGVIHLWSRDGRPKGPVLIVTGSPVSMAFVRSNTELAIGLTNGAIQFYDIEKQHPSGIELVHDDDVHQIVVGHSRGVMASVADSVSIKILAIATGNLLHTVTPESGVHRLLSFAHGDRALLFVGEDRNLYLWREGKDSERIGLQGEEIPIIDVVLSGGDDTVLLRRHNTLTKADLAEINETAIVEGWQRGELLGMLSGFIISADRENGILSVHDIASKEPVLSLVADIKDLVHASSPDGKALYFSDGLLLKRLEISETSVPALRAQALVDLSRRLDMLEAEVRDYALSDRGRALLDRRLEETIAENRTAMAFLRTLWDLEEVGDIASLMTLEVPDIPDAPQVTLALERRLLMSRAAQEYSDWAEKDSLPMIAALRDEISSGGSETRLGVFGDYARLRRDLARMWRQRHAISVRKAGAAGAVGTREEQALFSSNPKIWEETHSSHRHRILEGLSLGSNSSHELREPAPKAAATSRDKSPVPSVASVPADTSQRTPHAMHRSALPHSGLFIRRSAAFGTQQAVGIRELIEQGVQIDKNMIRFDDFVDQDISGVPVPKVGDTLRASYGIAPVVGDQARSERSTHFLEIALKATGDLTRATASEYSPPVNYVLVVDKSGSMRGDKLDNVRAAIWKLWEAMSPDDIMGIVAFDDEPETVLKATRKERLDPSTVGTALRDMLAKGGTDLNIGLLYGLDEIDRYRSANHLNHLYLLTDGNPTSGETNWIKIRQSFAGRTRGDVRLSTIAFGSDANTRELEALAGVVSGAFSAVTGAKDLALQLESGLARRDHLAAMNLQLQVMIHPEVGINYFYGHDLITDPLQRRAIRQQVEATEQQVERELGVEAQPRLIEEDEGIRVFVPNLARNETYLVVLELDVPAGLRETRVGHAIVRFIDVPRRESREVSLALVGVGAIGSAHVTQHAVELWTSEVVHDALEDLYQGELMTARSRIEGHMSILRVVNEVLDSDQIRDDRVILSKFVSLARNLGQPKSTSDEELTWNVLYHGLNMFGRGRNGFINIGFAPMAK